jgi:aminopeptidase
MGAKEEQYEMMANYEAKVMKEMDAYIGLRAGNNISEQADVPSDKMAIHGRTIGKKVHRDIRVPKTKWVVLRYPTQSMAQLAKMSTEAFEDFYFDVCNLDYGKMSGAMDSLVELMDKTDKVRITGPGTDLSFSIKGIKAIKCAGEMNIPDGEVYTAPVRDSINGVISYNTPSPYQGFTFENVKLTFKEGKIIDAKANDTERITKIFDTDEGARYVGEFAIGVNPFIQTPMQDILFDEKIDGSFHFTPGQCYEEASNGNHSDIHWDLVNIQRPEYGGGEIYFDDVLIRKDGIFVIPELEKLNPENLK